MKINSSFTKINRASVSCMMVLCLLLSLVPSRAVFAEANKLYITPASSQMNIGTSFTVNVRSYADSDQAVGSANGSVSYPTNRLQVTSISVSGSNYGSPTITQGAGTIGFTSSRNPAPGGSAQIFSITFKATGAGTATVSFGGGSAVNGTSTTYTAGVFTIIDPNPPTTVPSTNPQPSSSVRPSTNPNPTPSQSYSPSSAPVVSTPPSSSPTTPDASTEPQPTPDPTGIVDSVIVDPILYTSATVSWRVNANNPSGTLTYGTDSTKPDKAATITRTADGAFQALLTNLQPGVRYFFTINAGGSDGKTGTYSGPVITRGFPVTLTITENKQPVKSGLVKIGNRSYPITSSTGKLSLGLAAGSYTGTITTDTASLSISLTVTAKDISSDNKTPEAQTFAFNLSSSPLEGPGSEMSILAFLGILAAGTVVLGLGFVGFMAYRRNKFESGSDDVTYTSSQGPSIIIDDGYDWKGQQTSTDNGGFAPPPVTPPTPPSNYSHNGLNLSEEEPLDMFEKAKQQSSFNGMSNPTQNSGGTEQNSSSPRSTTL